ncbi:hypothetical protein GCL60_09990 [Silvanigrella paludirubra]|uniref:KAP NTPase domain-containing protein n=1 Tax=Silvanigrella paludirubra TaxID=2499159 RepID=A0A6N6VST1_9BACT|nr:P-loop NTPase fold protein [Silvanigrella paludirubra]KAB8039177.1 hypothetical protein GCL60_09990 [Silvanigrella paludirubra]
MANIDYSVNNEHIENYLNEYIKMVHPSFAVLVDGEWGSGKTWFINNFTNKNIGSNFLRISLFGVRSISEIDDQIFRQLYPVLKSKPFEITSRIISSLVKNTIKIDLQKEIDKIPDYLTNTDKHIFIIDDFERCQLPTTELLGYLNNFIENNNQKIIIIANEKEIEKTKDICTEKYDKIIEKIVGRKFKIKTDLNKAFLEFLKDIKNKNIFEKNKDNILDIYKNFDYINLRTLKKSIIECDRFIKNLPENARLNDEFIKSCIYSLFIIDIHLKNGKLKNSDINLVEKLRVSIYQKNKEKKELDEKEKSIEGILNYLEKFGYIGLYPDLNSIYQFFEFGFVSSDDINNSKYFYNDSMPNWKKLINYDKLTDIEFEELFKLVYEEFKSYKYKKQGILKHTFGMFLYFSKMKIIEKNENEIFQKSKYIIQHMIHNNLVELESFELENRFYKEWRDYSFEGYIFWERESHEFKEISKLLNDYQEFKENEELEKQAKELLITMEKNPIDFMKELIINGKFSNISILKFLSQTDFIKKWIEIKPENRGFIKHVFEERYNYLVNNDALLDELDWLKDLEIRVESETNKLNLLSKYFMEKLKLEIKNAIEKIENYKKKI